MVLGSDVPTSAGCHGDGMGAPGHGARCRLMAAFHKQFMDAPAKCLVQHNFVPQIQSAFWNKSEIHDQLHDGGAMYRNFKIGIQSLDSSL